MERVTDTSRVYQVERRAYHLTRPGFRIAEMQIGVEQGVPWHFHNEVQDTFYVLSGTICVTTRGPDQEVRLDPGQTFAVRPGQPHKVTNAGHCSAVFLVLQGMGDYDYVSAAGSDG